eukprot:scaffold20378_cov21-Tisochrysis_lutea.AAC.1
MPASGLATACIHTQRTHVSADCSPDKGPWRGWAWIPVTGRANAQGKESWRVSRHAKLRVRTHMCAMGGTRHNFHFVGTPAPTDYR